MKKYNKWIDDLKSSTIAIEKAQKEIRKMVKGDLYSIEDSDNEILRLFDKFAGIDLISLFDSNIIGIASRVQWGKAYNTFTIRKERRTGTETEYKKRLNAIKKGYFYPALTMQIYCDNRKDNNILSMAMMKTIDLYELIETNPELFKTQLSDNFFIFIKWDDIKKKTDKKIIARYLKLKKKKGQARNKKEVFPLVGSY